MLELKLKRVKTIDGPKVELIKVKALPKERLPQRYLAAPPYCFLLEDGTFVLVEGKPGEVPKGTLLCPGVILTNEEWIHILLALQACGNRLYEINNEIREANAGWEGEFTITY